MAVPGLLAAKAPQLIKALMNNSQAQGADIRDPVTGEQLSAAAAGTQSGLDQQQAFVNALQGQNGIGNQAQVYDQLQGIAAGTGPSVAQNQLAQATGQNVANQAALMAGQRGSSANPGLIARQASMQGANIQQQAAGQAATLRAGEQMNAIAAAGSLANQQVAQQGQALGNYNQFAQGNQGQLLNSVGNANAARVGSQNNVNTTNAGVAGQNAAFGQKLFGGALNGASAAAGVPMAEGGEVKPLSQGDAPKAGPKSKIAQILSGALKMEGAPAMMAMGGEAMKKENYKSGGAVPGKAAVPGNSLKNDTVPAILSPGEVVIPRSVMQSKDPAAEAAKFVAAIVARKGKMPAKK